MWLPTNVCCQYQRYFKSTKICYASQVTSTNHPLFQQPYKYINLFGQVQPRVVQVFLFPLKWKRTLPYSVIFGKEMRSCEEGVWIFSIVSFALRLLYEKVLKGKWGWRLVKMSNVLPVVSWKVLQTVAITWLDCQ